MTEFEFLSVLISMIFGLGLTHVLVVLVVNWWVIFTWRGHAQWSFDEFLVLVFWAISHYLLTITLYPPDEVGFTDSKLTGTGSCGPSSAWGSWISRRRPCAVTYSAPGTTCRSSCTTRRSR